MYKEILKNNIFTVSEYVEFLNNVLLGCGAKIKGEVNQVKKSSKGHVYFSLKDKNNSVLDCVIWNYHYRICGIDLKEGMQIIVTGVPSMYAPSGRLNFKTASIEIVGEGGLKKQYEELKKKLKSEGIFERSLKLPACPKNIGIITSKNGAVIHDFLNNLGKYSLKIKLIDSRVEGAEAIEDLINAIKTFKKRELDCLIVMRGGGAKNSFDVFNNEAVIREIIDFPCPIISGLGHHEDVPLFALASDYSVSTPTAAAELLNSSWEELIYKIKKHEQFIFENYNNLLNNIKYRIEKNSRNLLIFENEIKNKKKLIDNLKNDLFKNFSLNLKETKDKIKFIEKEITYNNPKRQLNLGYSIIRKQGKIVKSIENINKNDLIDLELLDGIIKSKVYDKKRK